MAAVAAGSCFVPLSIASSRQAIRAASDGTPANAANATGRLVLRFPSTRYPGLVASIVADAT
jgi:hypothetical protein